MTIPKLSVRVWRCIGSSFSDAKVDNKLLQKVQ
jgi:hypothetical protein